MANSALSEKDRLEVNPPLILGKPTYHSITKQVAEIIESKAPKRWWIALAISASIAGVLKLMLAYLVANGIGVWGNNRPVYWGWDNHQLRLLDRYRPRRYADFGDSVPVSGRSGERRSTVPPRR